MIGNPLTIIEKGGKAAKGKAAAKKAARIPRAAQVRSSSRFTPGGVHTKTRSAAPLGISWTERSVGVPRISAPARWIGNSSPSKPKRRRLWKAAVPNLPGWDETPVTTIPRG